MAVLDHLAIAASDLPSGVAAVEEALGVPLQPGGEHAAMGTHNALLSLGPTEYLEVIAVNPAAPAPGRPRWFALDRFAGPPAPRAWIGRCDDLDQALAVAPPGTGEPMDFARGDLRWRMAVPVDGLLPFGGVFPALITWDGAAHPAGRLTDRAVRLTAVEIAHPDPEALRAALASVLTDARVRVVSGASPALRFGFETPAGERWLA